MHPVFTRQLVLIHFLLTIPTLHSGATEGKYFLKGGLFLVALHLILVIRFDLYKRASVYVIICWLLGVLLLQPWYYGMIWGSVFFGLVYLLLYGGKWCVAKIQANK